jgi:hypothetical protein
MESLVLFGVRRTVPSVHYFWIAFYVRKNCVELLELGSPAAHIYKFIFVIEIVE